MTNANPVPVQVKTVALVGGALVEFGVPTAEPLRADGGKDFTVDPPRAVGPGATVELVAHVKLASPTIRALYGFAELSPRAPSNQPCDIPVSGADPFRLLGRDPHEIKGCNLHVSISLDATC